jgi:hypothetical protein
MRNLAVGEQFSTEDVGHEYIILDIFGWCGSPGPRNNNTMLKGLYGCNTCGTLDSRKTETISS